VEEGECWVAAADFVSRGETAKAVEICSKEPCSRVPECRRFLGWTYYSQNDWSKSLEWFGMAAQSGDADALFGMGSVYFVQRNFAAALQYYERSAKQGYPRALGWAAYMHHQGLGTPKNIDLAVEYYKKAAAGGSLIADRALIHLTFQRGTLLDKVAAIPRFLYIAVKAGVIAYRDINDPRISDVPNAFDRRSRKG
jgi:tetratricopeptide (TPR) repeat protein